MGFWKQKGRQNQIRYFYVSVNVHFVKMMSLILLHNWPFLSKRVLIMENF